MKIPERLNDAPDVVTASALAIARSTAETVARAIFDNWGGDPKNNPEWRDLWIGSLEMAVEIAKGGAE